MAQAIIFTLFSMEGNTMTIYHTQPFVVDVESNDFQQLHTVLNDRTNKLQTRAHLQNFGSNVRLWLKLRGLLQAELAGADKTPKPNLLDAIAHTFAEAPTQVKCALGLSGHVNSNPLYFWQDPERLRATLVFVQLSPAYMLNQLGLEAEQSLELNVTDDVIGLLTPQWRHSEFGHLRRNKPYIAHLGGFVRSQYLQQHGSKIQCAIALAGAAHWGGGKKVHQVKLSQLLNGAYNAWSISVLKTLTKFVTQQTGKPYAPERIAREFEAWCKTNPPPNT